MTATKTPAKHTPAAPHVGGRSLALLRLIAVFKLVKAAALVAAGLSALQLLSPVKAASIEDWLQGLVLTQGHRWAAALAERGLRLLSVADDRKLREVAIGAFLYATVFLVEGIGLARGKRWAEYLTVVVTVSFLPFEVVALVERWTWARMATIALNLLVVGYLIWQLRQRESTEKA